MFQEYLMNKDKNHLKIWPCKHLSTNLFPQPCSSHFLRGVGYKPLVCVAASQAILPIPQLCSCFPNKTNPNIRIERNQYYGNVRGLRSNFPFLKWFSCWHFQKHMAPCSASGFLGCAVPLPGFPELTVPHTHAHTNVQWCPALHSSLSAEEGGICASHPLGPSGVQSLLLWDRVKI